MDRYNKKQISKIKPASVAIKYPLRISGDLPIKPRFRACGRVLRIEVKISRSDAAGLLSSDIIKIKKAWRRYQASRHRDAVYDYLTAVFALVTRWLQHGVAYHNSKQLLRLHSLPVKVQVEPFSVVITSTSDPAKVDRRTRSKWSRALRYATSKPKAMSMKAFMKATGGLNRCAARARTVKRRRSRH